MFKQNTTHMNPIYTIITISDTSYLRVMCPKARQLGGYAPRERVAYAVSLLATSSVFRSGIMDLTD